MTSDSRHRLLAAATKHFADRGPVAATLDEIRRDASVSVGSLYHHFAGKEDLYAAAWLDALERYQAAFAAELDRHPGAEQGIKAVVRRHVRWLEEEPDGARLLLGSRPEGAAAAGLAEHNAAFFALVGAWWKGHAAEGTVRRLPIDLLYAIWLGPAQEHGRLRAGGVARPAAPAHVKALADAAWRSLKNEEPT